MSGSLGPRRGRREENEEWLLTGLFLFESNENATNIKTVVMPTKGSKYTKTIQLYTLKKLLKMTQESFQIQGFCK